MQGSRDLNTNYEKVNPRFFILIDIKLMEIYYDIEVEIHKKLAEKKKTVKWLAKQINCDNSNLGKIIKGERQFMFYQIDRISRVLEINLYYYFYKNMEKEIKQLKNKSVVQKE